MLKPSNLTNLKVVDITLKFYSWSLSDAENEYYAFVLLENEYPKKDNWLKFFGKISALVPKKICLIHLQP